MKIRISLFLILLAALALGLAPLPGHRALAAAPQHSAPAAAFDDVEAELSPEAQECDLDSFRRCLESTLARKLAEIRARTARLQDELRLRLGREHERALARLHSDLAREHGRIAALAAQDRVIRAVEPQIWTFIDEGGWLGVQISEVTAEKARELKLPAERGVLVTGVESDSPAAKAGLRTNDVITELNGQRIEGTAQFRRMIRETPPGRTVQLGVWRDGKALTLSAQLAGSRERVERELSFSFPREFDFRFDLPRLSVSSAPRLGIDAEDLRGQLGQYFGAPDGEGVLVREVTAGSPADKAGLKAGDVIIKLDAERVRSLSDLREKLRAKRDSKTVALTILRKGSELTLNVAIEPPPARERRVISRRITL